MTDFIGTENQAESARVQRRFKDELDGSFAEVVHVDTDISVAGLEDVRDPNNEQDTPLLAAGTFDGQFTKVAQYPQFQVLYAATETFTAYIVWSDDGITPLAGPYGVSPVPVSVISGYSVAYFVGGPNNLAAYYHLRIVNGATPQGVFPDFISVAWLGNVPYAGSFGGLADTLTTLSKALLTRAAVAGFDADDDTFYNVNVRTKDDGTRGLQVAIEETIELPIRALTDWSSLNVTVDSLVAVHLDSAPLTQRKTITVVASANNTASVYIYKDDTVDATRGELSAGQSIDLELDETAEVWAVAASDGQLVSVYQIAGV